MSKISAYSALASTGVASDDVLPIVDTSATATKKIALLGLLQALLIAASNNVLDTNGNELLKFTTTASAVNELTVANAATGNAPVVSATGGDTNIGIALTPKGTGGVTITGNGGSLLVAGLNGASNPAFQVDANTASSATGLKLTSAAAAAGVDLTVLSSGTNESLTVNAKGTGTVSLNPTATGNVILGRTLQFPSGGILADAGGNELIKFPATVASAVNELTVTNAAAAGTVAVAATGGDTNIPLSIDGKGTGLVTINGTGTGNVKIGTNLQLVSAGSIVDANGNEILKSAATVASAVNELTLTNSATGNPVLLAVTGGDTNTGIKLNAKGSGTITIGDVSTGNVIVGTNLQHGSAKAIVDAGGNESIKFPATVASAVNEFTVSNAATAGAPTLAATGGDTNISVDLVPKADGVVRARSIALQKVTQTAATDTAVLTVADLLTGIIDGTPTGAADYTLPDADDLVAGIANARVGDSFSFLINNKSGGANTITVLAGSGGTADGTVTVAQNVIRRFTVIVTNVTAAAEEYFVYGEGA